MASIPLTFAALATSAVPELEPTAARKHSDLGQANFTSVVLDTQLGQLIMRVPNNDVAAAEQAAENIAFTALTDGARAQLPFAVPKVLGITRAGDFPAVVATFLPGFKFQVADLSPDALLIDSLVQAIVKLHQLPKSLLAAVGLPVHDSLQARAAAASKVAKAWDTGLLPATLKNRWDSVLADLQLWDFTCQTVHGKLCAENILVQDEQLTGMVGFSEFSFNDPAIDFVWLTAAKPGTLESVLERYCANTGHVYVQLLARVRFYHELELASWLLYGVQSHNQEIITDAKTLLENLAKTAPGLEQFASAEHLTGTGVNDLLEETAHFAAAAKPDNYPDLFDDDRAFSGNTDFIERSPQQ